MRSESVLRNVAAVYRRTVDAAFFADAAVLTAGKTTVTFSREPTVPPLDQVSELKALLAEIDGGGLTCAAAADRIATVRARPPVWSRRRPPAVHTRLAVPRVGGRLDGRARDLQTRLDWRRGLSS